MKKLLFSILILTVVTLSGQVNFNRAVHDINERPVSILLSINKNIYFLTDKEDAPGIMGYLYKYNNQGILKFRTSIFGIGMQGFKTLDGMIFVAKGEYMCDFVPENQVNEITKIDTSGNAVFTTTYTVPFGENPHAALQFPDSSYYTFTDSILYRHDKAGQFISKTNTGLKNISSALLLSNNTILLSAKQNNNVELVVINPNGSISSSKPFPVLINQLSFYGGQNILGRGTDGKIYKISAALDLIASSTFTAGYQVKRFFNQNDTIYTLLTSTAVSSHYAVTDTSFNILSQSATSTQSIYPSAICLNDSKVAILAAGRANITPGYNSVHYFTSLNVIDKSGSNNFVNDLAILSVEADSMYATNNPPGNVQVNLRARIKIKNNGTRIDDFKLNCFLYPSVACGSWIYQQSFTQQALLTGDTVTVITNTFVKKLGHSSVPSTPVQYCFYTTLPDGTTDKVPADNEICKSFTFTITGIHEIDLDRDISIFPNPFQNTIKIESGINIKSVIMVNTLGMRVKEFTVQTPQSVTLDNSELTTGIYFIQIETEKGTVIKKVVKS